eukprot:snap_masked-scaffold871_size86487-processed-gene-0.16 protein:Tk08321 transcript:snap_masked-scaffold871_size86487-processed-gene-0.16-mRNA-1 annotation:"hypothetical protein PHACADRAFT_156102"
MIKKEWKDAHAQEVLRENKSEKRLADEAFVCICNAINDLSVKVREKAADLMGQMDFVSQRNLEQTLDKKLMSNLRVKRTAHERESKLVSSGETKKGRKCRDFIYYTGVLEDYMMTALLRHPKLPWVNTFFSCS